MNAIERDKSLRVRMSERETMMLRELAEAEGITASDWIRIRVRREYAASHPTPTPKPTKKGASK